MNSERRIPRILFRALRKLYRTHLRKMGIAYAFWRLFARSMIGEVASVQVGDVRLDVFTGDAFGYHMLVHGTWEPYAVEVWKWSIADGMTVVDVGAHVGLYALIAGGLVGRGGKVYAFEPDPSNFELLTRNIRTNRLDTVFPVAKAVSNGPGLVTLYLDPSRSELHSLYKVSDRGVPVEAVSLDEFFHGERIDVIKIDVEGNEIRVLDGLSRILTSNPAIRLFIEYSPGLLAAAGAQPQELFERLAEIGFVVYRVDELEQRLHLLDTAKLEIRDVPASNLICSRQRLLM